MVGNKIRPLDAEQPPIDPIGVELVLGILSASVTLVSAVHQFGLFSKRDERVLQKFKSLREELLRLHNCLDDLILTIHRHSLYQSDETSERSLTDKRLTLSNTLFRLKQRDYYRWLDIKEAVFKVSQRSYLLISEIRSLSSETSDEQLAETLNNEILIPFDKLLLNFGSYEFGDFVSQLRQVLSDLDNTLNDVIYSHKL
jgi:hypothetical protein